MKNKYTLLLLIILILSFGCSLTPVEDELEDEQPSQSYFQEDAAGNLLTINYSGERIALYSSDELIKILPTSAEEFLINVPTQTGETDDLKVYRYDDVLANLDNPSSDDLLLRWLVPLSGDTQLTNRVTWIIDPDLTTGANTSSGYADFSYAGGSSASGYYVDIFLGSRTGAKLATFRPGERRKVGLPYGNHTLLYRYWESNNTTADSITEIGWIEDEIVNNNEEDIWLILSGSRPNQYVAIPHWAVNTNNVQYGKITITNSSSSPVQIYVGSDLITNSSLLYINPANSNNETIEASGSREYLIVQGTNYTFTAKSMSGVVVDTEIFDLVVDTPKTWGVTP